MQNPTDPERVKRVSRKYSFHQVLAAKAALQRRPSGSTYHHSKSERCQSASPKCNHLRNSETKQDSDLELSTTETLVQGNCSIAQSKTYCAVDSTETEANRLHFDQLQSFSSVPSSPVVKFLNQRGSVGTDGHTALTSAGSFPRSKEVRSYSLRYHHPRLEMDEEGWVRVLPRKISSNALYVPDSSKSGPSSPHYPDSSKSGPPSPHYSKDEENGIKVASMGVGEPEVKMPSVKYDPQKSPSSKSSCLMQQRHFSVDVDNAGHRKPSVMSEFKRFSLEHVIGEQTERFQERIVEAMSKAVQVVHHIFNEEDEDEGSTKKHLQKEAKDADSEKTATPEIVVEDFCPDTVLLPVSSSSHKVNAGSGFKKLKNFFHGKSCSKYRCKSAPPTPVAGAGDNAKKGTKEDYNMVEDSDVELENQLSRQKGPKKMNLRKTKSNQSSSGAPSGSASYKAERIKPPAMVKAVSSGFFGL